MKKYVLAVLAAILLIGAAIWLKYPSKHNKEAVLARAKIYWEATRLNDLYTRYTMEAPVAVGKGLPHQYRKRVAFGARVAAYKLGEVTINGDTATVQVETEATLPDFQGKTFKVAPGKDVWTYIKGEWYHGIPDLPKAPEAPAVNPPEEGAAQDDPVKHKKDMLDQPDKLAPEIPIAPGNP